MIGWEHTFVHEISALARLHRERQARGPRRRDFEDGYRTAVICDAMLESGCEEETGRH